MVRREKTSDGFDTSHANEEAYVGLGSNIEPRDKYIERALNLLSGHARIEVQKVSSIYETEAVGGPSGQKKYLNAVCRIRTDLAPEALLDVLQDIEQQLGRKRQVRWGPRTIDLDILLFGQQIIATDRLVVPHALMHQRRFVMQGLAEIAPEAMHPILQMSAQTILESLGEDIGGNVQ